MTPVKTDKRIVLSRQLLNECKQLPNPINLARVETEIEFLEHLLQWHPDKSDKINRLIEQFRKLSD